MAISYQFAMLKSNLVLKKRIVTEISHTNITLKQMDIQNKLKACLKIFICLFLRRV